ncbi:uncharacterized protein LOC114662212 [Erpetoichthys calabaricus]|uniref:uncharacterized protein LOC114662212 n=1 Tax=Erpetoichthys calabaricus TaxID=27687 RepID=UPI00223407B1|nr:uncharacterized protein LOC114662212 [Erpetoichthys calabaricus]
MDILSWALKLTRCVLDHDSEGFLLHYDQLLLDTQLTEEVQAVLSRTRELTRLPLGEFLQLEENYGKIQVPRDNDTGVDWCPASCDRLNWSVEEHGCPRHDWDKGEEKSSKIKSGHQGDTAEQKKDEPIGGDQNQSCPEEAPPKTPQSEGHPVSQAQVEHHDNRVPADGPLGVQAGQFTPSECTGENAHSDEKTEVQEKTSMTLGPKAFPVEPPMGRDSKLPDSFYAAPHQLQGREKSLPSEACKTAWQEVGNLQRHGAGDKQTRSGAANSCTRKMGTFCKEHPEEGSAGLERRSHAIMRTPKRPFRGHKVGKTVQAPPSGTFGECIHIIFSM